MAITNALRTATFRITAYYVLVFVGSLLLIAALFYFVAAEFWEDEIREIVEKHVRCRGFQLLSRGETGVHRQGPVTVGPGAVHGTRIPPRDR